ncbi:RteC domain-containing protein [Aegicerativicinus sediminis]|uniref:RteC domain-containing protein n=1 Tax=Aegicerativicinus sediminis TaxID=2893202 RepID=UPI001E55FE97|nr:RteC domain-containing protein [Aegicerativicinus sediminis]
MDYKKFKELYNLDSFNEALIKSKEIKEANERLEYWKDLLHQYKKDKTLLSPSSTNQMALAIDAIGETTTGSSFRINCEQEIALLQLDIQSFPFKENIETVNWKGSQTELIELIKALIENGTIKGKQKDLIPKFCKFFNIEIKDPDSLLKGIKNRSLGSETLFLNNLTKVLQDYINKSSLK